MARADNDTPPVITPTVTGRLGNNDWYTSDVTVRWTVSDEQSAITHTEGCDETTITSDTDDTKLSCTATSAGGTHSESVTIKRDATPPTLSPSVSPNPVLLNGSATATPNASDNLSGVASQSCAAVTTSTVGSQSLPCTATDHAGNTAEVQVTYTVAYAFSGFTAPVSSDGMNLGPGRPSRSSGACWMPAASPSRLSAVSRRKSRA